MKGFRFRACCSALAFVVAGTGTAHAQDSGAPEQAAGPQSGLQDIIVTARRVEENQQRVPVAVTTLTAGAIERNVVRSVTDIQFSVPNLQIRPSALSPSVPEFVIRGQRQVLFTDENVVTYVNGVPQSTRGLTLYDIGSVQTLKGPQGTLFGKNSLGGAMVFTWAKPTFDLGGKFDAELGNYDRRSLTAALNVPIVAEKVALRIAGNIERRDGVTENVLPGAKDLGNRHVQSGRVSLRLQPNDRFESNFYADILRRREIPIAPILEAAPEGVGGFADLVGIATVQALKQQSQLGGSTAVFDSNRKLWIRRGNPYITSAQTGFNKTIPSSHYDPVASNFSRTDVWGIQNDTSYELSDVLTVRNIIGYRSDKAIDQVDNSTLAGYTVNIGPIISALSGQSVPNYPATSANNVISTYNRLKQFSEEIQIVGKTDNFNFIIGGFYSHTDHVFAGPSHFTIGPIDLLGVGPKYQEIDTKSDSMAVFAQGTYDFSGIGADGLRLTLGARHTWDKRKFRLPLFLSNGDNTQLQDWTTAPAGKTCLFGPGTNTGLSGTSYNNASQCEMQAGRTYKALTWTASLEYQATPDTLFYLANRRGYKQGWIGDTSSIDYAVFNPERITDYELGLKHQGRLGSVAYRFNVAAFIGKYKDIQTPDLLSFCNDAACTGTRTDQIIINVGKATIKGVEIDGSIVPFRDVTIDFGYSFQDTEYGKGSLLPQPVDPTSPASPSNPIDFNTGVSLVGNSFAGIPKHTANAAISYRMSWVPESFAKPMLSGNWSYRGSTTGSRPQGVFETPAYSLFNARLALDELMGDKNLSLSFWVQNLTNKAYKLRCSDNLNSIAYATCFWGEPRTYGATASIKF
jgi:iron complex outermembrane receptor protein